MPKRGKNREAPHGFRYIAETDAERAERAEKRVYRFVYRLQCLVCDQRIWGSGMGIASHSASKKHSDASATRRANEVYGQGATA